MSQTHCLLRLSSETLAAVQEEPSQFRTIARPFEGRSAPPALAQRGLNIEAYCFELFYVLNARRQQGDPWHAALWGETVLIPDGQPDGTVGLVSAHLVRAIA